MGVLLFVFFVVVFFIFILGLTKVSHLAWHPLSLQGWGWNHGHKPQWINSGLLNSVAARSVCIATCRCPRSQRKRACLWVTAGKSLTESLFLIRRHWVRRTRNHFFFFCSLHVCAQFNFQTRRKMNEGQMWKTNYMIYLTSIKRSRHIMYNIQYICVYL